jgi:transcriptional regulator with XRE-family HTH domain
VHHRTATFVRYLAANVRRLRAGRGLTQAELAEAAGLEPRSIRAVEGAKTAPRLDTIVRLADALEVPIGDLFAAARLPNPKRGRPKRSA